MKKLLALLLALAMVISMVACGGKKDGPAAEEPDIGDPGVTVPYEEEETAEGLYSFTFTQFGDAKVTIAGAEFVKNDYDEDVLRIYYDYTNTGSMGADQYPDGTLYFKSITQDGVECPDASFFDGDEWLIPEDWAFNYEVQPGLTSRCTKLIDADPNGGVIEVSCYVMSGSWVYDEADIDLFTFQIDPKDMLGPPEPLVLAPITNPTYAANLPTSGSFDGADVTIDGCEVVKGDEGENVLRVKLTVTNTSELEMGPIELIGNVEAYQDGLGLPLFVSWYLQDCTEADEATDEVLMPGDTVECTRLFELRNDSPIEVVIEEPDYPLRLGMIVDVKDAMAQSGSSGTTAPSAEAAKLIGTWLQRDSDWDDTFIFNADGTGKSISGWEYDFTYTVNGSTLFLDYGDDTTEEFTIAEVTDSLLTLVDMWDEELLLDKQDGSAVPAATEEESEEEPEEVEEEEEWVSPYADAIVGTWKYEEPGWSETYTFRADGTGDYCSVEGSTPYECTLEYEFRDDDYIYIYYSDGDHGGLYIAISGNVLTITNASGWTGEYRGQ